MRTTSFQIDSSLFPVVSTSFLCCNVPWYQPPSPPAAKRKIFISNRVLNCQQGDRAYRSSEIWATGNSDLQELCSRHKSVLACVGGSGPRSGHRIQYMWLLPIPYPPMTPPISPPHLLLPSPSLSLSPHHVAQNLSGPVWSFLTSSGMHRVFCWHTNTRLSTPGVCSGSHCAGLCHALISGSRVCIREDTKKSISGLSSLQRETLTATSLNYLLGLLLSSPAQDKCATVPKWIDLCTLEPPPPPHK